jgi:alpha-amylase/alpha-mannosidase (GH57 family)
LAGTHSFNNLVILILFFVTVVYTGTKVLMERYVCIHGHFYQPPRENPWLEDVELQDGAYPYHDWNAKITEECYRQNAASRILSSERKIIDIVNNYEKMSFNFGPTLMTWLEKHEPDIYKSILDADKQSQKNFPGHGAAIAQAYNHIIMPLANRQDKITQILWGLADFEMRFGRKAEGMWLPETAVDNETLDIMAENGIKFTILSPTQAKRVRRLGDNDWYNINHDQVDTTQPYLCKLPSGRTISLFFYHGPIASDTAAGRILTNGEVFADKLLWLLEYADRPAKLAHIATDGETFGHHHRFTDMALAYCTHYIETKNYAKITVYGEYLEKFPPNYEAEIYEHSSWSCIHGIERWQSNCGCNGGRYPSGKQQWRKPLRWAMDWLRDQLIPVYETEMAKLAIDPWLARNEYIKVINDRRRENIDAYLKQIAARELKDDEKVTVLKLLEMQRNAMLMYTSCGWFFDDIAGIETLQIMQYAARVLQLAKEIAGKDLEPDYENILEKADCNLKEFANGKKVYESLVKTTAIDLNRVGAHLAASLIFDKCDEDKDIYCYSIKIESCERIEAGIQTLAVGRATIQSNIVLEKHSVDFAVLHFGDHNLTCAVNARSDDAAFNQMQEDLKNPFINGDTNEVMRVMSIFFKGNNYSLWHLFKDQQRRVINEMMTTTSEEVEAILRRVYEHNYTIMQTMRSMRMPLPSAICDPAEFITNLDLQKAIRAEEFDVRLLKRLTEQVIHFALRIDTLVLRYEASNKINYLMAKLKNSPGDIKLLEKISTGLGILLNIVPELDLQTAQNIFYDLTKTQYSDMKQKCQIADKTAQDWCRHFHNLANYLGVKID